MRYTWIPFYKEFAEKLMNYRPCFAALIDIREQRKATGKISA